MDVCGACVGVGMFVCNTITAKVLWLTNISNSFTNYLILEKFISEKMYGF